MSIRSKQSDYLRTLENPYAFLEIEDETESAPFVADIAPTITVHASENPYAQFYYREQSDDLAETARSTELGAALDLVSELTQAEFEQHARRIFRPYMPAAERTTLRPHYREFIARNKTRSPAIRARLIRHLQRYDLSQLGVGSLFNREPDLFTQTKLLEIEKLAEDDSQ